MNLLLRSHSTDFDEFSANFLIKFPIATDFSMPPTDFSISPTDFSIPTYLSILA